MQNITVILISYLLLVGSCTTVSDEPLFDTTPVIEIISISNDTIVEFQESLHIIISYEDGDGDLGSPDPDENTLFVKDNRLKKEDEYFVYPLAPYGESISITGTLSIALNNTFILGNGTTEQTNFTIYMIDRAGNKSNVVKTETITIVKP